MAKTYVKNIGMTRTFINGNINEVDWEADYNGKNANINVYKNNNGVVETNYIKLNNNDLANILNTPSTKGLIHKRLITDFKPSSKKKRLLSIDFSNEINPLSFSSNSNPLSIKKIMDKKTTSNNLTSSSKHFAKSSSIKKSSSSTKSFRKCRKKNGKFKKCTYRKKSL